MAICIVSFLRRARTHTHSLSLSLSLVPSARHQPPPPVLFSPYVRARGFMTHRMPPNEVILGRL
jgi:hypothetical protein